eukprot:TRINITY_DN3534_c0_g1_i1.p1 TRINITY_DN3534_c0_g1~~TRINITY_DN3534_c0_g1_i1.p1  ORF type:complete len:260 (+),score=50.86 TRINITY_DN3534_c0_g1_i1:81-782(+)
MAAAAAILVATALQAGGHKRCGRPQDAGCATGETCTSVPFGSQMKWCVTANPSAWLQPCTGTPVPGNECCSDANCTQRSGGVCDSYADGYCGGAAPPQFNVCRYDQCDAAGGCSAGSACIPRGFLSGYSRLVTTCHRHSCLSDADCHATGRRGGRCLPFESSAWCSTFQGFFCAYEGDECTPNTQQTDCTSSNPHCISKFGPSFGPCTCEYNITGSHPVCALAGPPPPSAPFR